MHIGRIWGKGELRSAWHRAKQGAFESVVPCEHSEHGKRSKNARARATSNAGWAVFGAVRAGTADGQCGNDLAACGGACTRREVGRGSERKPDGSRRKTSEEHVRQITPQRAERGRRRMHHGVCGRLGVGLASPQRPPPLQLPLLVFSSARRDTMQDGRATTTVGATTSAICAAADLP